MRQLPTTRVLALDLELTCWENGVVPEGQRREIVEFGIVEADLKQMQVTRRASVLVRTRSEVSDYFVELTGITREEIARDGHPLPEVLRTIAKDFGVSNKSIITWGNDFAAIARDCAFHGVDNPFRAETFLNIGQMVSIMAGEDRRIGLYETMRDFDVLGGGDRSRRHRGVDDAFATMHMFLDLAARYRQALKDARDERAIEAEASRQCRM